MLIKSEKTGSNNLDGRETDHPVTIESGSLGQVKEKTNLKDYVDEIFAGLIWMA